MRDVAEQEIPFLPIDQYRRLMQPINHYKKDDLVRNAQSPKVPQQVMNKIVMMKKKFRNRKKRTQITCITLVIVDSDTQLTDDDRLGVGKSNKLELQNTQESYSIIRTGPSSSQCLPQVSESKLMQNDQTQTENSQVDIGGLR